MRVFLRSKNSIVLCHGILDFVAESFLKLGAYTLVEAVVAKKILTRYTNRLVRLLKVVHVLYRRDICLGALHKLIASICRRFSRPTATRLIRYLDTFVVQFHLDMLSLLFFGGKELAFYTLTFICLNL